MSDRIDELRDAIETNEPIQGTSHRFHGRIGSALLRGESERGGETFDPPGPKENVIPAFQAVDSPNKALKKWPLRQAQTIILPTI